MEIPGTAPLKEAKLRLTTEAGAHVYLLEEPATGRLFRMSAPLTASLLRIKAMLAGRRPPTREVTAEAAALSSHLTKMRGGAIGAAKPFNPLFTMIPLFDARPLQPRVAGISRLVFSRIGQATLALLTLCAAWLGAASDFVFIQRIGDIFSLEALATFALIAPFLKAIHEAGHLFAATRFGVPVRNAGLLLIALFPLPFVDCTEAEFRAGRRERIVISLAGLLADIAVGLVAFIAWHFAESGAVKDVLSHIVILNTATTIVFNLNPLMRLDGYFALSDALHRRNLHMNSAMTLAAARRAFARFDFSRLRDVVGAAPGQTAFGAAAFFYKIYILLFIAWTVAPKYLGLGAAVLIWGAAVMFLTPMMKAAAPRASGDGEGRASRLWWLIGPAAIAALAFIPLRYAVAIPAHLDTEGIYAVRADARGRIEFMAPSGDVAAGERLMAARDVEVEVDIALNDADQAMLGYLADSVRAEDPLAAQGAEERIRATRSLGADLAERRENLSLAAPVAGWFVPDPDLRPGVQVETGARIGVLLPDTAEATLVADAPALYADKFRGDLTGIELRSASGAILSGEGLSARMERIGAGPAGGETFRVLIAAPGAPLNLGREPQTLRLTFAAEPLWRHAVFLGARMRLAFLRAQAQDADVDR